MKNEIKTKYLIGEDNIAAAADILVPAYDSWIPQDAVKVVGIELATELMKGAGEMDSGFLVCHAEVSKIGKWHGDGTLLFSMARIDAISTTIAAGSTEQSVGKMYDMALLMLPDSKFVDLDEGEPLYVNLFTKNTMAVAHAWAYFVVIYYIEK